MENILLFEVTDFSEVQNITDGDIWPPSGSCGSCGGGGWICGTCGASCGYCDPWDVWGTDDVLC